MKVTLKKSADPARASADLLVVTAAEGAEAPEGPAAAVDAALGGVIARAIADGEVDGSADSVAVFHAPEGFGAPRVAVVGVGAGDPDGWRRAGAAAAGRAKDLKAGAVAVAVADDAGPERVGALLEGLGTGARRFDRFTSGDRAPVAAREVRVHGAGLAARDVARAARVVEAVNGARDLVDTPANHLTPSDLAAHARDLADRTPGLECTVIDRDELERLGATARNAPALIVLRYRPARVARAGR